jgi:hypothetical protein
VYHLLIDFQWRPFEEQKQDRRENPWHVDCSWDLDDPGWISCDNNPTFGPKTYHQNKEQRRGRRTERMLCVHGLEHIPRKLL